MENSGVSISTGLSEMAREKLREAVIAYGRHAFADPRRCEAILRDLCPTAPREVFLLVSALRENVATEMISSDALPQQALTARLTQRLSESLCLSEEAAQWAVESWRYALDDNPGLRGAGEGLRQRTATRTDPPEAAEPEPEAPVDWPWLGMCFVTVAAAALVLAAGTWIAFFHQWRTWPGALVECAALAAVLSISGFAQMVAARSFAQLHAPDQRALNPRKVPYALLPEVLVILLLPLVPVAVPAMWGIEWWGELHAEGLPHATLFHVIRAVESLLLLVFLRYWIPAMVAIQGRIASSLVRQR